MSQTVATLEEIEAVALEFCLALAREYEQFNPREIREHAGQLASIPAYAFAGSALGIVLERVFPSFDLVAFQTKIRTAKLQNVPPIPQYDYTDFQEVELDEQGEVGFDANGSLSE